MPAAFADLDRAIALDPKNAAAFRLRAESFRVINRIDRALADANEAIRLDPDNARGYDNRGNAFLSNKQYDRAIEDYNEAIKRDPKYRRSYMDRGAAYYFKGDYQNAIKNYDQAIKLDPKRAQAYTNRAAAYKKLGRVDQAIADDSTAIKMEPDNPEFYDNRGLSYEANGDYDRAIADFNEAIRLKPKANFLTNRGDGYNQKGELRPRHRRLRSRHPAQSELLSRLQQPRRGLYAEGRSRSRHRRFRAGAAHRSASSDSAAAGLADAREQRDRRASISGKNSILPSFNCGNARRAVEKAICSDPELARLDREVDDAYRAALARLKPAAARKLKRQQREFNARRNGKFGKPEYQFKRELERRLAKLRKLGS